MAINPSREEWKIRHGVFDQFTLRALEKLRGQGHFEELQGALALGKEANVFTTHSKEPVIIKIYRLENRDFNKMNDYLKADPRYMHTKKAKRAIVFAWTQREYRNLLLAREAIPVPKPIAYHKNVLVMSQIGSPEPAPKVKDKKPQEPQKFWETVADYANKLREEGLIHGDLSEFNILNDNETPLFIDFSQATPSDSPNAEELWERDTKNIIQAAKKQGASITPDLLE